MHENNGNAHGTTPDQRIMDGLTVTIVAGATARGEGGFGIVMRYLRGGAPVEGEEGIPHPGAVLRVLRDAQQIILDRMDVQPPTAAAPPSRIVPAHGRLPGLH